MSLGSSFKALIHQVLTVLLGRKNKCPVPPPLSHPSLTQPLLQSCLPVSPLLRCPWVSLQRRHPLPPSLSHGITTPYPRLGKGLISSQGDRVINGRYLVNELTLIRAQGPGRSS